MVIRVPGWAAYPWLRHGFSTRREGLSEVYGPGELNLGYTRDDDRRAVDRNRRAFRAEVAGVPDGPMVVLRQVHGTRILSARMAADVELFDGSDLVASPAEADGLMTAEAGLMLAIQAADCVPVLVADRERRVVAGFHAGWRGTVARIVEQGIGRLRAEFGCRVEDLIAAVGPSIGRCCYTVGEELRDQFEERFTYGADLLTTGEDGLHLDLAEANRRQLLAAGLAGERITVLPECTACARVDGRRKFFSHRAENGFTGRGMGMIGIADKVTEV